MRNKKSVSSRKREKYREEKWGKERESEEGES